MANAKLDLRNPIYHDDNAAREHLERLLWPQGPHCPRCGVTGDRITKLQGKSTRPGVYKCKDCRKPFSVTVGTVMERSHVPLSKWILAAQLMASSKKSMSAHQLHRMLDTNYETAWFLFHRLREAANDKSDASPLGGENKVIEADESFIGGKARNKAFGPPPKKMAVFRLVEREGHARSKHVADVTAKSLREAIVTNANRESYLMTDEALVYERLGKEFAEHGTVNHSAEEYVRTGGFHIPTRSNPSSLCLSAPSTVNSITLARLICTAILPKQISNTITALPSDMTMQTALMHCYAVPRASGFCIDSLTEPCTPKQKARALLRWHACRETE
jgi:transposase-like protein